MKSSFFAFICIVAILAFASCNGKFHAAYGGGLWFIPLGAIAAAAWTWGRFFKGWRIPYFDDDFNPKRSRGSLVFALIFTGFAIGAAWLMWIERAVS